MSSETTTIKDQVTGAAGFLAPVRELFGAIVVLDRYKIEDVFGNVYTFRPVLSARRQIETAIRIDDFWQRSGERVGDLRAQMLAGPDASENQMKAALWFVREAIQDDVIQAELEEIWEAIHPSILKSAREAAIDAGSPDTSVLDLFPAEALVEGLLPFFARFGTNMIDLVNRLTGTETGPPSTSSRPTQPTA